MTGPGIVSVDPGELHGGANQWHSQAVDIHGGVDPNDIEGDGVDHQAARDLKHQIKRTGEGLGRRLDTTADSTDAAADGYTNMDEQNAQTVAAVKPDGGMKPNDMVSMMNSFESMATSAFGIGPQLLGATTGLVGSSAGVIGSLTGAVTSASKASSGHDGDGNSNNTNPEDSHDYVHGNHTAGATTPASGGALRPYGSDTQPPDKKDEVRLVSHDQPMVGVQPMMGGMPMGLRPPTGGSEKESSGPTVTVKIVTDQDKGVSVDAADDTQRTA